MASLGVLGLFGSVPFTCSTAQVMTFKNLQVQRSARFAKHDLIGRKPVLELVGPELTTLSFTISLRSQFNCAPTIYLPMLQTILETGEANRLLLGPDYFGKYVLESYSEDRKFHNGFGVCIGADVSLFLREAEGTNLLSMAADAIGRIF